MTCALASAFLGGMLWINLTADKEVLGNFHNTFDENQRQIMQHISGNRLKIWWQGIALGMTLAFVYLYSFGKGVQIIFKSCVFTAIVMTVNYFYYMLSNKGTYMIEHLRKDQVDEWLDVKVMMQRKYHIGLLLGAIGCFLLARGLSI